MKFNVKNETSRFIQYYARIGAYRRHGQAKEKNTYDSWRFGSESARPRLTRRVSETMDERSMMLLVLI